MTPFRLRLLVTAFLAIATAISVNALYFQAPSRLVSGASASGTKKKHTEIAPRPAPSPRIVTTAALPPATSTQTPPAPAAKPAEAPQPDPLVGAIQKKLVRLGYKTLPEDGLLNRETRAAILAAEFEQGMPLTGEPGEAVHAALFFLEASGRSGLASADKFERNPLLVKEVQDLLAKLGYSSAATDGRLDAGMRGAIRRFETDRRLAVDGRLNERTLLELLIERGKPFLSKG